MKRGIREKMGDGDYVDIPSIRERVRRKLGSNVYREDDGEYKKGRFIIEGSIDEYEGRSRDNNEKVASRQSVKLYEDGKENSNPQDDNSFMGKYLRSIQKEK
jgi:hypothetical protein